MRMLFLLLGVIGHLDLAAPAAAQAAFPADRGETAELDGLRDRWIAAHPELRHSDVLLITIDAIRPDQLGCYGAEGETSPTPTIDRLAAESVLFEQAFAPSPHRLAALHGILASQYPTVLRGLAGETRAPTAAAAFSDHGYRIWGFFQRDLLALSQENLGPDLDLLDVPKKTWEWGIETKLPPLVARVLEGRGDDQRHFGWVHLPFPLPPARHHPGIEVGADQSHHDAAVRYADRVVEQLLDELERQGSLGDTVVAVVGTHGWSEHLARDAKGPGDLTEASLHVPMLIRLPEGEAKRHAGLVETVDMVPTLLALTGHPVAPTMQGKALLSVFVAGEDDAKRLVFAETRPHGDLEAEAARRRVASGEHALILPPPAAAAKDGDAGSRARLEEALTSFQIWNDACVRAWRADHQTRPRLEGDRLHLARALWLDDRDDPLAREAARVLLRGSDVAMLETGLRILHRRGTAADVDVVRPLEMHPDLGLRALVAAYLARHDASSAALDHALAGLKADVEASSRLAIVRSLSEVGGERVREALKDMDVSEADAELRAARVLALARLGDAEAADEAVRLLLDPQASHPRRPFVETLLASRGEDAGPILDVFLRHGRGDREAVLSALDAVVRLGAREAEGGVVAALSHPDRTVRTKARAVLDLFGSLAFHPALVARAGEGPDGVDAAARGFLATPELIGTPVLPGAWLAGAARADGLDALIARAPYVGSEPSSCVFSSPSGRIASCALIFALGPEAIVEDPSALLVEVAINGASRHLATRGLREVNGIWVWVGAVPEGVVEVGNNTATIRVAIRGTPLDARALALVMFPQEAARIPEISLLGDDASTYPLETSGALSLDAVEHHVWIEVERSQPVETPGHVELRAADEVLAVVPLPSASTTASHAPELARPLRVGEEVRLVVVANDTPPRALRVLVYREE